MPYTRERLQHALMVFRLEPGETKNHESPPSSKYNTRSAVLNAAPVRPSHRASWLRMRDNDPDEDYDPSTARKKKKPKITPAKRSVPQQSEVGEPANGAERSLETSAVRVDPRPSVPFITLLFTTEAGRAKFRALTKIYGPGVPWPRYPESGFASPTGNENERAKQIPGFRVLRNRRIPKPSPPPRGDEAGGMPQSYPSQLNLAQLHCDNGHLGRGERFVEAGSGDPCDKCAQDDIGTMHLRSKEEVEKHQLTTSNSTGKSLLRGNPGSRQIVKSPPVSDLTPIINFYTTKKKTLASARPSMQIDGRSRESAITIGSPSPEPETLPTKSHIRIMLITTAWSHPINFHFQPQMNILNPDSRPAVSCHFCYDFRYRIFGVALRTCVQVVRESESTFKEIGGGNRSRGCESTRMCGLCALEYIRTSECPHQIVPFVSATLQFLPWRAALRDRRPDRDLEIKYPCCALCPSPASFYCRAPPVDIRFRKSTGTYMTTNKPKCRFFLCSNCNTSYGRHGKNQAQLKRNIRAREVEPRADIEFLFAGSDCHKAWGVK